ncbi:unnamed protein product [Ranitomeya imitator]|uniref:Uncharacterized protein n=1 Tax=Ranitomeya imitator TaxID=111125 RepID=A0ABN9L856_9NEOB|nr:unnamed protein product [Ranitomeya imitator]
MEINEQNGKLSAEVEPFVPQKKGNEAIAIPMSLPGDGGNVGGLESTPIPSYLITCYPFVQENQSNRQFPLYINDIRWQQSSSNPPGPYLAYPIVPAQPPVSTEYMYYQLMPAPCAQVMGFYHPFPASYTAPLQATSPINAISIDCNDRTNPQSQVNVLPSQRTRNATRPPIGHKQPQQLMPQIKCKRPPMKSVAVQKETCAAGPDARSKIILLVDACQQTDFPNEKSPTNPSLKAWVQHLGKQKQDEGGPLTLPQSRLVNRVRVKQILIVTQRKPYQYIQFSIAVPQMDVRVHPGDYVGTRAVPE